MRSLLVVTTPAADLALLTSAELFDAVGLPGSGNSPDIDPVLEALGLAAAAAIADACNVAVGEGAEPTLLQETLTETFYDVWQLGSLVLSRRHMVDVDSITRDGQALAASDYTVGAESGIITFVSSGRFTTTTGTEIVVVYDAGFPDDEIPPLLKQAAKDTVNALYLERSRDPYVKGQSIEVADIETVRTDYWAGRLPGQSVGPVPAGVAAMLKRFTNRVFA